MRMSLDCGVRKALKYRYSGAACAKVRPFSFTGSEDEAAVAQSGLVRQAGQGWIHPSKLAEEPGVPGRYVRRPPGHRYLQYLERAHTLQRPFPRDRGVREARRARSWRISARVSRD